MIILLAIRSPFALVERLPAQLGVAGGAREVLRMPRGAERRHQLPDDLLLASRTDALRRRIDALLADIRLQLTQHRIDLCRVGFDGGGGRSASAMRHRIRGRRTLTSVAAAAGFLQLRRRNRRWMTRYRRFLSYTKQIYLSNSSVLRQLYNLIHQH